MNPLDALDRDGWTIIRRAVDPEIVRRLAADLEDGIGQTAPSVGPFYGAGTRRFGRLLARSPVAERLVLHPQALALAREVVGRNHSRVGLNLTQLIAVSPGAKAQVPHRDDEMWPLPAPSGEHLVNVLWPLTPFRAENGATRVWTGSHRSSQRAPEQFPSAAEMEPGDALVVLGSTLHAQGANDTSGTRTCVVVGYHAAWLIPGENPWLSYPPEIARTWSRELTDLIGYRRLPPNLNGVDCRCPSDAFAARDERAVGAVDALTEAQHEGLRRFHAGTQLAVPA